MLLSYSSWRHTKMLIEVYHALYCEPHNGNWAGITYHQHRVGRVLSFFSSRPNWDSLSPLAAGECDPPTFGKGGRAHSLAGEELGESQFRRGDIHCGALYTVYKPTSLYHRDWKMRVNSTFRLWVVYSTHRRKCRKIPVVYAVGFGIPFCVLRLTTGTLIVSL